MLCIVLRGNCVIVFYLFIAAPSVCVGYVLTWAWTVLLLFFFCSVAPIGCVGYVLSWAMIVLLLFHCILLLPLRVQVVYCPWR